MAWEESEEFQRAQARILVVVFVLWVGDLVLLAWRGDETGILWLGAGIGGLVAGISVWTGVMALLLYGGQGVANLWRALRGKERDRP
jgi:hypothetical protein